MAYGEKETEVVLSLTEQVIEDEIPRFFLYQRFRPCEVFTTRAMSR
jgi:hypothetical protein